MSFTLLVLVVVLGSLAAGAAVFAIGKMWRSEASYPPITKAGKVRKTAAGVVLGFLLFLVLGGLVLMKPPLSFQWEKDHDRAFARAGEEARHVFIDFWANWCGRCNDIERQTFGRDEFKKALRAYVPLKVDASTDDDVSAELRDRYGAVQLPTFVLASADGARRKVLDPEYLGKGDQTDRIVGELRAFAAGLDTAEEKGAFAGALEEGLLWALLAALLGGLVTAATPCVFPMIPITVSIIGSAAQGSQRRAFWFSLVYVGGMALCYSVLGVVVGAAGGQFGALFQNAFFLVAVALVFLVLAAHMLEVHKLRILMSIQMAAGSARGRASGVIGIFLTGVLAGFLFAPCVGPILLGVLTYIGETGDILLGFLFMFTFAVGMGLPFVVLGTFTGLVGKVRGKGGDWMVGVEAVFGAALVAAALYFLVPVVPPLAGLFDWLGSFAAAS